MTAATHAAPPAIAILGLGAIGSMLADQIARASQSPALILADAARRDRWRQTPPTFNGTPIPIQVRTPSEAATAAPPAVILLCVKATGLAGAMEMLPPFIGPQTQVLPLLNGVTSEAVVAKKTGEEHVLYAHILCHTAVRKGAATLQSGPATLFFGEAQNTPPFTPRVAQTARLLQAAGIHFEIPPDMRAAQWEKYILNVGLNQASAVLNAPHGEFQTNPDAMAFARALMQEAAAIGNALGIPGVQTFPDRAEAVIRSLPADRKTSMAQDVEAGRPTELALFAGWLVPQAARLGIPVPANQLVLDLLGGTEAAIQN